MAQQMQTPAGADTGYGAQYGAPADRREGRGWRTFAAVMFTIAGVANFLWGIAAITDDRHFAGDQLIVGDLTLWGVLALIFGGLQLLAAYLVLGRRSSGAVIGIGIAMFSAFWALLSLGAYPLWSMVVLVIDGLIVYGLTVYGFDET